MIEVSVVGRRGVLVVQRQQPVGARHVQTIKLSQRHGLDDGISLLRTHIQIPQRVFPRQPVEQLPSGVAKPKKRLAVFLNQKTLVVADLEHAKNLALKAK